MKKIILGGLIVALLIGLPAFVVASTDSENNCQSDFSKATHIHKMGVNQHEAIQTHRPAEVTPEVVEATCDGTCQGESINTCSIPEYQENHSGLENHNTEYNHDMAPCNDYVESHGKGTHNHHEGQGHHN